MALIPVGTRSGRPYCPNPKPAVCNSANAVYIGDYVVLSADGGNAAGIQEVDVGSDGGAIYGVVVGIVPTAYDSTPYKTTATTERTLLIETDPSILYAIKEDGTGGFMTVSNINNVVDIDANGTGSNSSGLSANVLDSNTAAAGSAATFVISGLHQDIDNAVGSVNTIWEVYINEAQLAPGNAGNGV